MKPDYLFTAGWRAFFLAAGLWAVVSVAIWLVWLGVHAFGGLVGQMGFAMAPHLWHAHEMVFGYAAAAVAGFFLTAVPNWTGATPASRRFVTLVAGLWLVGRLAVWLSGSLPMALVAVVDLAFLPVLAVQVLGQLRRNPKPQNMMVLLLLALVWTGNLLVHVEWLGLAGTEAQGLRGGLMAVCAMIAVLGGRVIPAFTRNAMLRAGIADRLPVSRAGLDKAGIALAILTALAVLAGLPAVLSGGLAILAGLAAAARLAGWRGLAMPGQPILWALHLGYGMLAAGYVAWGLSQLGLGSETGALHILAIGAIGGMTLAVMSRAALGHSGRALVAPVPVALAYALMPLAALLRWAGSAWIADFYYAGVLASGLIWCLAFLLYLAALWPVLVGPRADHGQEAA